MMDINEIKAMALAYGACDKATGITSINEAIELLMTPQGREFALKTGFPTLECWSGNAAEVNAIPGVFFDAVNVYASNHDCILVGKTEASVYLSEPDKLYHIIAMHGARVVVRAKNYAVVTVTNIDADVTVETDDRALVFVEESKREGGAE